MYVKWILQNHNDDDFQTINKSSTARTGNLCTGVFNKTLFY